MRKFLMASTSALSLFIADINPSHAFLGSGIVLDPSNLAQNIEQVLQAIEQGLRTLEQIELANRSVIGTDFTLSPEMQQNLAGVQNVLRQDNILFDQIDLLDELGIISPGTFAVLDDIEQVSAILQQQNAQILGASGQLLHSKAVSAATITDVMDNVASLLGQSSRAQGETQALQLGNELDAQTIGLLAQMHANQLASQQLQAQQAGQTAAEIEASRDLVNRMRDTQTYGNQQFPGVVPGGFE